MRRAQLLAGAAVALGLVLPTGADAAGATYDVVYCDPLNRGLGDVTVREPHGYRITRLCDNADGENSVQVNSVLSPAVRGSEARVFWRAPAQLGIIGTRVDAKLRRDAGHQSRLYLADGQGRETKRIATGDGSPSPFKPFNWNGATSAAPSTPATPATA